MSHFLSTWKSRVFEFGAVLYLAAIFPGTLMPMSVYAVSRGLAAVFLFPLLGKYIDDGNRLQVVRLSIGKSRLDLFARFSLIFRDSPPTVRCCDLMCSHVAHAEAA